MQSTYPELLLEVVPEVIETEKHYDAIMRRFSALSRKRPLTPEERKLKELLGVLIQDYDRRNAPPGEDCSPAELLQFLVEQSGQSASALLQPVFGSRSHVSEALNGKRQIGADQARALGRMFHVKPGIFI